MAISQQRSQRKASGGRYKNAFSKKKAHNGNQATLTRIGELKAKVMRVLGGHTKVRALLAQNVNVCDPKTNTVTNDVVVTVVENPANRNYVRRNILTKGTVVELKSGKKAKLTSRPGQSKILNAVLVE